MSVKKEYKNFLLDVKDGIAIFTLNRPELRNPINEECWGELDDFMAYAETCDDIKVIIITGAGDKAFVAGADVGKLNNVRTAADSLIPMKATLACNKIENSMKIVIAAVNGYAFGGGCELAIACDLRIVSENAQFALPEATIGMMPGWGGTQRLSRLIGIGRAKEVILGGRKFKGQEAVDVGLAMKCVPLENLMQEAIALANDVKSKAPLSLAMAKKLIKHSANTDLDAGLLMETLGLNIILESEDKKEGTAAFKEKRKPEFKGR